MKIAVFDSHRFEKETLIKASHEFKHELTFLDTTLSEKSAGLAQHHQAVCVFVNDHLNQAVIKSLAEMGIKLIALRCAGFNHVDLAAAHQHGIKVVRVPEYSPYSVAEHAVALMLCLNRKIHRAYNRVREGNFSLDGLVGFDMHGKTVGVIGTGKIGKALIHILRGFGCQVIAYDVAPNEIMARELNFTYMTMDEVLIQSDIISLHMPFNKNNCHLMNEEKLGLMKQGSILINTSRGSIIDTKALIKCLKEGKLGAAGLDVYEEEEAYFFQDHSSQMMDDDVLARLMTFPNVILTGHQAFLTHEALKNIAKVTMQNISDFEHGNALVNQVKAP